MSAPIPLHTPPCLGDDQGRTVLLVDGVVQSISPEDSHQQPGYWGAMTPPFPPRRALILGLGGGTLAHVLAHQHRRGTLEIVGVDHAAATLRVAREAGWLPPEEPWLWDQWHQQAGWPAGVTLQVLQEDAFAYVADQAGLFDYIALDLYQGNDLITRSLARPFLRQILLRLVPRGWLVVNLFRDAYVSRRTQRLAHEMIVRQSVRIGANVIVHAQRR